MTMIGAHMYILDIRNGRMVPMRQIKTHMMLLDSIHKAQAKCIR